MRKLTSTLAIVTTAAALTLTGCSAGTDNNGADSTKEESATLIVAANPTPHAKILEFVRDNLAEKEGLKLDIKQFDDYIAPNEVLQAKEVDVNYFQTIPYLKDQAEKRGYDFVPGKGIHLEPLALYSKRITDLKDFPEGGQLGIINDPTNQTRALNLLAQAGFVEGPVPAGATINTVKKLKNFEFVEVAGPQLARSLEDVDAAVINGNFAQAVGLAPKDGLIVEETKDNPASNLLVWRNGDQNPNIQKLEKLLHSDEVRDYIQKTWADGAVLPSF
ncbi:MetQ/NlpA family ABC transporter substrate-binding protein [Boudabousia marimammalium]|uniref:Lipoprotein n=1 Tax=Boudabousia marimammalium TaxID=156892 RepID=A0A1Q5PM73_9ACTO|nr:MetQ/NlpA family ABC transporter substrate-binding protein [Boudabousia marimammalium]OKL48644.1 ABC transporter [Boudabousia marimammalium]